MFGWTPGIATRLTWKGPIREGDRRADAELKAVALNRSQEPGRLDILRSQEGRASIHSRQFQKEESLAHVSVLATETYFGFLTS